ncbi:MAG: ATP-binding protein [Rhodocyclaceae bacterium]|nr:ATP-binding protein [Rhodocyclaceae bacterium]
MPSKYSRKASSPVVEIGGRREKDACLLWVRDNGTGFDMAQHDKIFEIFQRAHGETEFPGTGVGLALVRRCVQRMGGRVGGTRRGRGDLQCPNCRREAAFSACYT